MEASTLTNQEGPGIGTDKAVSEEQEVQELQQQKEEQTKEETAKKAEEAQEEIKETIDLLEFQEVKKWTLGPDNNRQTYTQKPLSYLRKMQFFALVGATVRQVIATGEAGALSEVLGSSGTLGERAATLAGEDFADAESFISLASSLAIYVPDFLEQAYCVILNVPPADRDWVKAYLEEDEENGGLSDEDHRTILQTFIAQNYEALRNFFVQDLPSLWKTVQAKTESQDTE